MQNGTQMNTTHLTAAKTTTRNGHSTAACPVCAGGGTTEQRCADGAARGHRCTLCDGSGVFIVGCPDDLATVEAYGREVAAELAFEVEEGEFWSSDCRPDAPGFIDHYSRMAAISRRHLTGARRTWLAVAGR